MKNTWRRLGYTCALMLTAGAMTASMLSAEAGRAVTVSLPYAVEAGAAKLPAGEYTITSMEMADGEEYFLVRSPHTQTIALHAQKIVTIQDPAETKVVLSKDRETWRMDKLFVAGDDTAYQFLNSANHNK